MKRLAFLSALVLGSLSLCAAPSQGTLLWDGAEGARGWERWTRNGPESPTVRVFEGTPPAGQKAVVIEFPKTSAEQTTGPRLTTTAPKDTKKISFWSRVVHGRPILELCLVIDGSPAHSYVTRLYPIGNDWEKIELDLHAFEAETKNAPSLDISRVNRILFRSYKNQAFGYAVGPIEASAK